MSDVTIMLPNRGIRNEQLKDAGTTGKAVLESETEADGRAALGVVAPGDAAPGLVRLVQSLKAGGSDTLGVLGDSTSNGANKWLRDALADVGTYVGEYLRIVERLNSDGTGQTWTETVIQEGAGRPYWEQPIGGTKWSIQTGASPALDTVFDLDIRVLCSVEEWDRSTTSNGLLVNYGDGAGTGAPFTLLPFAGGSPFSMFQFVVNDSTGTSRIFNITGVSTAANLGAAGELFWLRVTFDADNGSSNSECKVWVSKTSGPSEGLAWTQLGSTGTAAVLSDYTTSTTGIELLGRQTTSIAEKLRVYAFEFRNGIGDTFPVLNSIAPHTWWHNYSGADTITPFSKPTLWVINRSVSGSTLDGCVDSGDFDFIAPNWGQSVYLENFGYNDTLFLVSVFLSNLELLKTELDSKFAYGNLVTVAQPPRRADQGTYYEGTKKSLAASQYGSNLAAGYVAAYHYFMDAVNAGTDLNDLVSVDGTHPTAAGYALWKTAFLRACGIAD
jgi:hypothetical protein